jgi:hypothetical protein
MSLRFLGREEPGKEDKEMVSPAYNSFNIRLMGEPQFVT